MAAVPEISEDLGLSLALFAGLRRAEITGLKWGDVDLPNDVLHIQRIRHRVGGQLVEAAPKSSAGVRDIPISPELADSQKLRLSCAVHVLHRRRAGDTRPPLEADSRSSESFSGLPPSRSPSYLRHQSDSFRNQPPRGSVSGRSQQPRINLAGLQPRHHRSRKSRNAPCCVASLMREKKSRIRLLIRVPRVRAPEGAPSRPIRFRAGLFVLREIVQRMSVRKAMAEVRVGSAHTKYRKKKCDKLENSE